MISMQWSHHSQAVALAGRIRLGTEEATLATLHAAFEDSQQRVPVGPETDPHPGALKASGEVRETEGAILYTESYAVDVEYGTRRMAAEPFMTPAIEGQRATFLARIARLFR